MLYPILHPVSSNDICNQLVAKLQSGENPRRVYEEVEEFCKRCNPSNPMTCLESCDVWALKKKSQDYGDHLRRETLRGM